MATHPHFGEAKHKTEVEKGCECYGRNKGNLPGRVPHCNFYFVELLVRISSETVFSLVSVLKLQQFVTLRH